MTQETMPNEILIQRLEEQNKELKEKVKELRQANNSYIYNALVKLQAELPIIQKNATRFANQKYADFAEIIRISRPFLVKNGLALTQTFKVADDKILLVTKLCHVSGQFIESQFPLIINKDDVKTNILHLYGGATTFLRRYCYCSIVGIATDDDTDGN